MKGLSNKLKILLALYVAVVLVGLLTLALYKYYSATTVNWSKTKDVSDVLENVATVIAFGAGAVWAYFNFFKGRTYRSRLEPTVSGKLISRGDANYLIVTAQLKNVGLSNVRIDQKGSALRVFAYTVGGHASKARSVEQSRLITFSVFEDHGWIEPGELIEDQRLVAIPDIEYVALQIKLRLVSNKIEWNSAAIIEAPQPLDSPGNKPRIEERAQASLGAGAVGLLEGKKPTDKAASSTEDIANITMQKKEDAEESRRIEEEKDTKEITNVKQQTPKIKEEAEEISPPPSTPSVSVAGGSPSKQKEGAEEMQAAPEPLPEAQR